MPDRVAKLRLGSLKVRQNSFCRSLHILHPTIFLLLLIRFTEASIPVSLVLEFLRKTMNYAVPGRAIFDDVFVFAVVPVIHDIKNWTPEICRICLSNKYLVLQINCASLWPFFDDTALQNIVLDFSLTFKRKVNVSECINVNQYLRQ